jgi:hypothetical protein
LALSRLFEVTDDNLFEPEFAPGVARGSVTKVEQQARHARAHGAQSDNANFGFFHTFWVAAGESMRPEGEGCLAGGESDILAPRTFARQGNRGTRVT